MRSGPTVTREPNGAGDVADGGHVGQGQRTGDVVVGVSIALLTVCAFFTLLIFRAADDNRLTSWHWVFADADVPGVAAILVGGIVLAYMLSNVPLPGRYPAPLLFLASFLLAAMFWREPEVIVDAARYFTQAKHLELYGIGFFITGWGKEIPAWTDLPLIPFLYGVIFSLWGEARGPIQVFTTLLFSGTVVLTYLIGKTLWDDAVGFYAGALLLGMPYLLTQVPLMLVDVPTMFFLTLAVFTTIRALDGGGAGWIASSAAAVALAFMSKYSSWALLSVGVIVVLVYGRRGVERAVWRAAMICLAAALLAGVVVVFKSEVIGEQLRLLASYQVPGLRRWRESFASTFVFQVHPFLTAAAAYSAVVAARRRDLKYAIVAWLVFVVVALQVERIRYLLVVFPALALMASYGLREIRSVRTRRFAALCIVMSSLVVALFAYLPFLMKVSAVNLREAGEYLDSLEAERVEVFVLPQVESGLDPAVSVPLLDLFTGKQLIYDPEPASPPAEGTWTSPLRFTWEYRTPAYYRGRPGEPTRDAAVVVISGHPDQSLPAPIRERIKEHRLSRAFEASDGWFQYQTLVRVYQPVGEARSRRGG